MVSSVLHSRKDLMLLSESTQQVCAAFSFYNPNFLPGWAHTEICKPVVARVGWAPKNRAPKNKPVRMP